MSLALDPGERLADHGRIIPFTRPMRTGAFRRLAWARRPSAAERDAFQRGLRDARAGDFRPGDPEPPYVRGWTLGRRLVEQPLIEWLAR